MYMSKSQHSSRIQNHKRECLATAAVVISFAPLLCVDAAAAERNADAGDLEVVIVTAQKRNERLQDVPIPVTSVSSENLVQGNQLRVQDFFTSVPGLKVVPSVQSNQTLSIRGITTGSGNPTVGVTVDDVPYGSSTNSGGGRAVPDIDPGDLARVEVLRGPQGTLYGASSLGGLLKFVMRDPSMDEFSGRLQAGVSSVHRSDDLGYSVRGAMNVPLGDTAALNASAFTRQEAGYVDNVRNGEADVNTINADGGRLSALWRPSEMFSLKFNALIQQIEGEGTASVDPALGDLKQSRVPGTGEFDRQTQAYSVTLVGTLGGMELTSITGYNRNKFTDSLDAGFVFGSAAQAAFGVNGGELYTQMDVEKTTEEIRLATSLGDRVDLLVGGFYTDEDSDPRFTRWAVNPQTGAIVGRVQFSRAPETFEEYAAFVNLTFHFTDRFDVQVGGRQSQIDETFSQVVINAAGVPTVFPNLKVDADAFTYLVTPRFKVTPDLMVYARLASGYRAGGPNNFPGGVVPAQYDPDKTENYELGLKGEFFDRVLSIDTSVYYIDWKDIQISALSPASTSYLTNGSGAKSQGVELSFDAHIFDGNTISGWVAHGDAELTEAFPAGSTAYGAPGNRLPDSSRWSGSLSVDQEFSFIGDFRAFAGASLRYVGDRLGAFRGVAGGAPLPRQYFPSYEQVDLRLGIKNDSWTANLFVNNAGDERSALYGGLGALPPTAFTYIQPRTIGLSLVKAF